MIKIFVDSSADYEMQELNDRQLGLIPLAVTMNGTTYADGVDLQNNEFFEMLISSEEFPKTSQPSPSDFLSVFEKAKEDGDEVICILLSSALSGTYQSALLAKSMVDYEDIYVIDSLSATYPIRIMTDYACSLAKQGLSAKEIADKVAALRPRVKLLAVLDTLEYLSKGGRIPKSVATIGEIARIKPVITLTAEGEVGVLAKCIGKNKAMSRIMQEFSSMKSDPAFPCTTIFSYGTENCEAFEQKLTENGYAITERMQIGAAIGSHIGPRAYGIVFVEK